jgi:hypothetical protein
MIRVGTIIFPEGGSKEKPGDEGYTSTVQSRDEGVWIVPGMPDRAAIPACQVRGQET